MTLTSFPEPRVLSKGEQGFYLDVKHWLSSAGHEILRQLDMANQPLHDVDTLSALLHQILIDQGDRWIAWEGHGGQYRLNATTLPFLSDEAAQWALETFKPARKPRGRSRHFTKEMASKGGLKGKRKPKFTEEQLQAVEALSIPQQAEALGCSQSTISRIRRRIAATPDPDQLILDSIDAEIAAKDAPEEEEFPSFEEEVREIFASMGAFKMSDGSFYIPDPDDGPVKTASGIAGWDPEAERAKDEARAYDMDILEGISL